MQPLNTADYRRIVVLTGAGISVASGLRPYRGPGGLWEGQPELLAQASAAAAKQDPSTTWRSFAPMREAARRATPNAAHLALAALERDGPAQQRVTVITQNIDGLHQRAGSGEVVELHGSLSQSRCSDAGCSLTPFDDARCEGDAPACPQCHKPLRPAIVLFDEVLPARADWLSKKALRDCDLFLAIGTSGNVFPAANFVRAAQYAGARTVFINLEALDPPNDMFQEVVLGKAEELLPRLFGQAD